MTRDFKFCPHCAAPFGRRVIHDLERLVCPGCGFIFWQNPVVGVAVVITENGRVLLGRRSRGEYAGLWCIPCGYVEYHEDVRGAAIREFREETGLTVEVSDVLAVHSNFHNPALHTVGIWFTGRVVSGTASAADDLDRIDWFAAGEIEDEQLAFPTDRQVLRDLFKS